MHFNKLIPELTVSNLVNSLNFYRMCGFKIEYERKEDKFAFLSRDEIQFMIQEYVQGEKWELAKLEYPFGRGINFQLEVENVQEIYDTLIKNDYEIAFPIEENWYRENGLLLGCKEFLVCDPDGYLLRFQSDLGSKPIESKEG